MSPRAKRRLVLCSLIGGTWLLLAGFVWQLTSGTNGTSLAVWGAVALAGYLWTIGYGVYYKRHWSVASKFAPEVNASPLAPLWPWFGVIGVVAVTSIVLGNSFATRLADFEVQLALQGITVLCIGAGLVWTVSPNGARVHSQSSQAELAETPPAFFAVARRVVDWTLVCVIGGAVAFSPAYVVMKGFERYVDLPACQKTCQERGYTFEGLKVGKRTYDCTCLGPNTSRHVFHERASITGGSGVFDLALDWGVRATCVLGTFALTLMTLVKVAEFYRGEQAVSRQLPPTSSVAAMKTNPQRKAPNRKR